MSAFVVSAKTVGNIAGYVFATNGRKEMLQRQGIDLSGGYDQAITRFSRQLEHMNREAVYYRYGEADDLVTRQLEELELHSPSTTGAFKSINCYLYQCAEGNVPDRTLFKALDKLRHDLAFTIATDTEEYKTGAWE